MIAGIIGVAVFVAIGLYVAFGLPVYGRGGSYWGDWR